MYYFYRFVKWKLGERSPLAAALKVTQRCNLSCSHCPWKNKAATELPTQEWKEIINRVWALGCTVLVFEGGEPTLRTDLQELVRHSSDLGFSTIIVTNGTQDISKLEPDRFWVSIDGLKEKHDLIRGKGAFERAFATIKNNSNKKIITLTTISRTNYEDIEDICECFAPYVYGFGFHFLYPYRETKDIALTKSEKIEVGKKIIGLKKKYRILNSEPYLNAVGRRWKCYPWMLKVATADGEFSQGCMVKHLEQGNCDECDIGCYGEMTQAIHLKSDAWKFMRDAAGIQLKLI